MKTAAKVIFIFDDVDGGFATAIIDGLQPDLSSPFERSKESFDLSLVQYGITDTRAAGNVTHFVDASGVKQVSVLVLQNYEPPILACAVSEVLSSLEGEDTSTMPSLVVPFFVDSSKLKLERKRSLDENIYGIQIGPHIDVIQALASRHAKAPLSLQIHDEPLSCVLQLLRALKTASFILIGQRGQPKTCVDDIEGENITLNQLICKQLNTKQIICEIGESLASTTPMQFVKEKVTWNPTKVSKQPENEPWRALYG